MEGSGGGGCGRRKLRRMWKDEVEEDVERRKLRRMWKDQVEKDVEGGS